jgi:hypothetical protein
MKRKVHFIILFLTLVACIETYTPPEIESNPNILVVDGFLDGTLGECVVKLTRTQQLGSTDSPLSEFGAFVRLEEKNGSSYLLQSENNGTYRYSGLTANASSEYRIYVQTPNGQEYVSAYTKLNASPEIDSVTWEPTNLGVEIQVTTHNNAGNSNYYQWTYEETWQYTSAFQSVMQYLNGTVIIRPDDIYNCWTNNLSNAILINSTKALNEDVVYKFPLLTLPKTSDKYLVRYSILVNQRVLTEDAYYFWLQMQKNTENLGTLFDPQPSKLIGNISNLNNSGEAVLGYFSASFTTKKRMFLTYAQLPDGFPFIREFPGCKEDTVRLADLPRFGSTGNLLTTPVTMGGIILIGYRHSTVDCVDCRSKGGTNIQPAFW